MTPAVRVPYMNLQQAAAAAAAGTNQKEEEATTLALGSNHYYPYNEQSSDHTLEKKISFFLYTTCANMFFRESMQQSHLRLKSKKGGKNPCRCVALQELGDVICQQIRQAVNKHGNANNGSSLAD